MSVPQPSSLAPLPSVAPLAPAEFAQRFQESARVLWTVAAGILGTRGQAEDVLQEAAVIGLSKLEQFDPQTSFTAWMGTIVRFVALNTARRSSRRSESNLDECPEPEDRGQSAAAGVVDEQGRLAADPPFDDLLLHALRELPPTARACLLLRVVLELDYRSIASTLNLPEGTAMSHVHRARQTLRTRLEGTLDPSSAAERSEA